jgi:hypothetical protein
MLAVTIKGLITSEASAVYTLTPCYYVVTPLLRVLVAAIAGAIALNALRCLVHLARRSDEELALLRTSGAGRWISLRRLFAVFDIPQLLAAPLKGRWTRVVLIVAGLFASSIGAVLWLMAPILAATLDLVNVHHCFDDHPDHVLACAAFGYECGIDGPLLGYVVIPASATLAGALIINTVKHHTRPTPLGGEAPIVFLRSFADDQARLRPHRAGLLAFMMDFGRSPDGIDQMLVYEFASRAPVVALGRPGERRPPFGAHRIYIGHRHWRAEVWTLIEEAKAVVLVLDGSEGVRWEIEQCLRRPELRTKTLFVVRKTGEFSLIAAAVGEHGTQGGPGAGGEVVGAYCRHGTWTILRARRPTRITYQIAVRHFFEWRSAAMAA